MPPRKEVYHEKQENGSTVWITYSFVDQPQFGKYKQRVDLPPSQSRNARVARLVYRLVEWGNRNRPQVWYPRGGYSVHLETWIWRGADTDNLLSTIRALAARDL